MKGFLLQFQIDKSRLFQRYSFIVTENCELKMRADLHFLAMIILFGAAHTDGMLPSPHLDTDLQTQIHIAERNSSVGHHSRRRRYVVFPEGSTFTVIYFYFIDESSIVIGDIYKVPIGIVSQNSRGQKIIISVPTFLPKERNDPITIRYPPCVPIPL